MGWECLPLVVLADILALLEEPSDRVAASQVWGAVKSYGGKLRIRVDLGECLEVIKECGSLAGLTLLWGRSQVSDAPIRLLNALAAQRLPLTSLYIKNWSLSAAWPNRSKIILALARFVRSLSSLGELVVENACFRQYEVFHLVRSLCQPLKRMALRSAFRQWDEPHTHPCHSRLLAVHAPTLVRLAIDYHALSTEILELFARFAGCLERIEISVQRLDLSHPPITDDSWDKLTSSRPRLQINLQIDSIVRHQDLLQFLQPNIPLRAINLNSRKNWDHAHARNIRDTLLYIEHYYADTLEDVRIFLRNCGENIDDLLVALISKCHKLNLFHYEGIIRNTCMIGELLESVNTTHHRHFKYIEIRPRFLNPSNRATVYNIVRKFERTFLEQSVDFKIVEPCSILSYV